MMQGQRGTVNSLPETFEFDLGSASNSSVMADPQVCWNNMLNGQNLSDYLLSPEQSHMPFENAVNANNGVLGGWNFDNSDTSGRTIVSDSQLNGGKMEHDWSSMVAGPSNSAGSSLHERGSASNAIPSLNDEDVNITNSEANTELELFHNFYDESMQIFGMDNVAQTSISNVGFTSNSASYMGDTGIVASDSFRNSPPNNKRIQFVAGSSSSNMTSSDAVEHPPEDGDSRRPPCKRKNIGGVPGQSSCITSSNFNQSESNTVQTVNYHSNTTSNLSISNSSNNVFVDHSNGSVTTTAGTTTSNVPSDSNSAPSGEVSENRHRNFRLRINSSGQQNMSISGHRTPGSLLGSPNPWHQPLSSLLPPPTHGRLAMTSINPQMQPHLPVSPALPRYVPPHFLNTHPNTILGSGGSSASMRPSDRFGALREEVNMGSLLRNISPDPTAISSNMHEPQIYLGLSSTGINSQGSMASTPQFQSPPASFPSMAPAMGHLRNSSDQLSLDFIRHSISTARANFAGQSNDLLQQSGQQSSLHMNMPAHVVRHRVQQQQPLRLPSLVDRQHDTSTANFSSRAHAVRERRIRVLSEIRNMIGALRRGENLRFEDLILDHSIIMGAVDLHDRHRDMRLDVDNMSYEELLALEERIGNVSTGLSEEAVSKCLKQRKYSTSIEESSEVEPCCVCQENYVEGDHVGGLECGHDFHTVCIKQWLAQKNMCPICKTAALAN